MDQTFLFVLCVCVGFISGYGVRAMISEYRRREVRKAREMHANGADDQRKCYDLAVLDSDVFGGSRGDSPLVRWDGFCRSSCRKIL